MEEAQIILPRLDMEDSNGQKIIAIDTEVHKRLKGVKQASGWSITKLASMFIQYGIDHVEIVDLQNKEE